MTGKVRTALVGAGWMGSTLLRRLSERKDVDVAAVVGRAEGSARTLLGELNLAHVPVYDDLDEVINNPAIDAVVLASPNSLHGPQSIAAIKAGKHVFCEKPCATRFDDFIQQVELERANLRLVTFVDYLMNFDPMEKRLQQLSADGAFGRISQIQVNYRHGVNISGGKAWKLSRQSQGDAIGMGIVHSLSAMLMIMKSQSHPVGIFATALPAQVRPFETEPIWNIVIRFADGTAGFCFGNIESGNGYDAYHHVSGTRGAFVFESQLDHEQKVRFWSEKFTDGKWIYALDQERCRREGVEPWPADTTTPDSGDVFHHNTASCIAHFIECITRGTKSPLSFVNSAGIAELGWAAQMSAAMATEVKLPLDYPAAQNFFKQTRA